MHKCLIIALILLINLSVSGQKIGLKYGITASELKIADVEKNKFYKNITANYIGLEYEISHWKPRFLNKISLNNSLPRYYWILELAYTTKGSSNITIPGIPETIRLSYLTFSPRIKIFDTPKKEPYCRVYGCCDSEDYGIIKPYINLYLGPKIDFLVSDNTAINRFEKVIFGAILSINTQIICFNSGSIFIDLQTAYDFNNSIINDKIKAKNYSVTLALGFKIRNTDNY